ncbi:Ring finger domain [Carpediemonas membranifera]|uniref:Ring finger domain n=1 Tax=Carpediemonas membranifera TaxID=201153 RepID=A0A8J6E1F7_9EUKA|nr:Ring finger domain [Carpediemonas membranifera]|eukprot:KAG9396294.1 Ring finger domain [Carpediemonas membranifera]
MDVENATVPIDKLFCRITMEPLSHENNPVITRCGHAFAKDALHTWLNVGRSITTCPVCRTVLDESRDVFPVYFDTTYEDQSDKIETSNVNGMLDTIKHQYGSIRMNLKRATTELEETRAANEAILRKYNRLIAQMEQKQSPMDGLHFFQNDNTQTCTIPTDIGTISSLAFGPESLAIAGEKTLLRYNPRSWNKLSTTNFEHRTVSLAVDRRTGLTAAGLEDGNISLIDRKGDVVSALACSKGTPTIGDYPGYPSDAVGALNMPGKDDIIAGVDGGSVVHFCLETGQQIGLYGSNLGPIMGLGSNPMGEVFVSSANLSYVHAIDLRSGKVEWKHKIPNMAIGLDLLADRHTVVIPTSIDEVIVMDTRASNRALRRGGSGLSVSAHPLLPSTWVSCGGKGVELHDCDEPRALASTGRRSAWSDDGRLLAIAEDGAVRISNGV